MLNMKANIDPSELQPPGEYDFEKNFNHRAARKWMEENWLPRSPTILITTSKMVQITGFVIINIFLFFWKDDKLCQVTWPVLFLSSSLYTTLFALFSNFFVKTYLSSTQKSKRN
ncbi:very long chain fatty acid elongase 3 [Taeniopygia guttata]|uniref:very long chain fatty acid elongase 3 n=1 Tax=Taeniopygia guttata TaxID=59729 RepID=UPI0011AF290D|nr:elongation of very long chain fatty acids protein 3 [Taeniopygia guttata]